MLTSLLALHYYLPAVLNRFLQWHGSVQREEMSSPLNIRWLLVSQIAKIVPQDFFMITCSGVDVCVSVWSILSQGSVHPAAAAAGGTWGRVCVWEQLSSVCLCSVGYQSWGSVIVCVYACVWVCVLKQYKKGGTWGDIPMSFDGRHNYESGAHVQ